QQPRKLQRLPKILRSIPRLILNLQTPELPCPTDLNRAGSSVYWDRTSATLSPCLPEAPYDS
ncbi:MAG: hypothetical protein ACPGD6_01270, partial [bacterium]